MRSRILRVTALATLLGVAWASLAASQPGSGSATIDPTGSVVAGSSGTWSITYTAADVFDAGTLRVTIPAGWTAPQNSSNVSAGYVSVSTNEPTGTPLLAFGGNVITITVDTLSAGNTITLVYGDDASSSGAMAVAGTSVGPHTYLVESDPTGVSPSPIGVSPTVQVIAAAPSYLTFAPSDTTVTAGDFAQYRLFVFDTFGNRAQVPSNRTVNLFKDSGQFYPPGNTTTPIASVVIPSGQSTVRMDYRGTLATGGTPHALSAITASGSPTLAGFDQVNVIAGAMSIANSLISATSPVVADGVSQSNVVVTSRDAFGNRRQGDNVTLAVTGSAIATNPGSSTDADGEAAGVVTNTVAQPVTVSAFINAQQITATAAVTFTAGPVSAATSTVDATSPVVANGIASSTITVTARDANSNPVALQSVTLAIDPTGNAVLTQPGGVTNSLGQVTGTLTSTVPGTRTVTATIGAVAVVDEADITFIPGPVASFQWTNVDGNAVAGVPEQVRLTAKDGLGNTVATYTGTVNLTTTSAGAGDLVVQWGSLGLGTLTNLTGDDATYQFAGGDNGTVLLTVTDTRAESIQLSAVSGPASGTSSAIVVAATTPDKVVFDAGNGQSATVNTQVSIPPRVIVRDQYDNPVPNATVTFRVITTATGVGSVDVTLGGAVDSTGTTASDGRIDCDFWRLGTAAGPNRLRALIASGSIPSFDFVATGTAGTGTILDIEPDTKSVTVNADQPITAKLEDTYSNPKAGTRVDIVITNPSGGTLGPEPGYTTTELSPTARWGITDANGEVKVVFHAPGTAGLVNTVDISTSTIGPGVVTATYTTIASGATDLRITFQGPSTAAAGQTFEFLVEAVDGQQNLDATDTSTVNLIPEALSTLLFSETDFGATVTSVTLENGQKTVYGRGTKTGDWDITVDGGGLGPDTEVVTITDTGVIDHYDVSTVASVVAGITFSVSVTARDAYNNIVVGASNTVNLEAIDDVTTNPAQSTLLVGQTTLASGFATQAETYTFAEPIRIRATGPGTPGISNVVSVTPAAAYRIAKVSGDNTGVPVGGTQPLVAQVFDAFDNPVVNELVTFVVQGGGGSVLPATDNTDASGLAQTTLTTGSSPGNNLVKATILDENPGSLERIDYLVETVPGVIAYFEVVPSKVNPIAGEVVNLTITAFDAQDNPVTGDDTTQIQLTATSGTAQFGAATGTLANGEFTTTVTNNFVGPFTVTAELLGGGPPEGDSPVITVSHAPAFDVVYVSGDASVAVGSSQVLQARVRDQFTNPVPNHPVTFLVASSPGGATITDPVGDFNDGITQSDATGLATATVHTSLIAGANLVYARILDGVPPLHRVTFTVNTQSSAATALRITFLGPTTVAAGQTSSFKVEALDAGQNLDTSNTSLVTLTPEATSTLEFSVTGFPATVTSFNLQSGTRTVFVRGTKTGNWDITVDDGPAGLSADTDAITVNDAGVVDHYFVSAPANVVAGASWNLSVEARDVYDNKVVGASNVVNLTAVEAGDTLSLTGVALTPSQTPPLVGGAIVTNVSYTRAEGIRVRVRDAGNEEGFSGVVQVGPAAAYKVLNVGGDGSDIVAGAPRPLTARVLDIYDNPVPGQNVSFSVISGGGSIVPPVTFPSDGNGEVVRVLNTGTIVGTNVARAQIGDGNPPNLETASFTVNTIAGAIDNYVVFPVDPLKINLVANETTSVRVRARDQYNNRVIQDNSTVVNLTATGSVVLGVPSGTLTAGDFTTTVRDDKAETFTVSANSGIPTGTSATFTVSPGPAYQIVKITPDPVNGLSVGNEQPLVSEVRDQWNNPVGAGVPVTHLIVQAPDASAYLNDTVGDPNDGITTTAANGQATVDLGTANTAGLNRVSATILDGTPAAQERVTYDVNTVPGGIAYYTVDMGAVTTIVAGTAVPFTVRAFDSNDNPVDDDVTQVALTADPGVGLVFGTNPITLTNGVASTTVTANQVQLDYRVRASTVTPAATGVGTPVDVTPASPAGVITATATADTITANGISTTTLTSSVITDAFGNQVPAGGGVNVTTSNGAILGVQPKIIGANGRIAFDLRSSTTPGTSTVTMTTVLGSATGQKAIEFAEPAAFASDDAPLPSVVKPGDGVSFSVPVQNTSTTAANLTTATRFVFSDGVRTFTAFLAGAQTVPAAGTEVLVFSTTTLDAAFTSGNYSPVVTLIGSDQYGAPFNVSSPLPANSLQVTNVEIIAIAAPSPVSRGQTRNVTVTVENQGAVPATLNTVSLQFSGGFGVYTQLTPSPALPLVIAPGNTQIITIPVTIQPSSNLGTDQIDAFIQATVGGQPVIDDSVDPYPLASWQIVAQANLAYLPGTLTPATATLGRAYSFQMSVQNGGSGVVALNQATTRLTFTDGTTTFSAAPVQAYAIAGGATQVLNFVSTAIPGGFPTGSRDVVLDARGTDNGAPFTQLVTAPGALNIVTPAVLSAVAGTLTPTVTSKGATAAFQINVNNTGGATVVLVPATTTISFPGFSAELSLASDPTVSPGITTLTFTPTVVGAGVTPGSYIPQIEIVNAFENGLDYDASFASPTSVLVQAAPDIAITAILPSQATITADQARRIQTRMVVQNNGGATVSFTSASLRLFSGAVERTSQFAITAPVNFVSGTNLAPAETDTLVFQVSDAAGAMSAANLVIEGLLNVEDIATTQDITANTNNGGKGALTVQTPAALSILAVTPSQSVVTASMAKDFLIRVAVRNTGQSDVDLQLPAGATLAFTPMLAGWVRAPRATLAGGGVTLSGGETDTVFFDVTQAGSITGPTTVSATLNGTETNSGRGLGNTSPTPGNITVQAPGAIDVTSVVSSRETITSGANVPWTLTVTVHNPGEADVDLSLGAAVLVSFGGATTPPVPAVPLSLAGGGTRLSGGETDQFVVNVPTAGTYGSFGPQSMQVLVTGDEFNSGDGRGDSSFDLVTVQAAPTIQYLSLTPSPVAQGVTVPYNVVVRNPVANGATITLNPATTRLQFAGGAFDAGLAPASPVDVSAGQLDTLLFTSTLIPGGIPTGPQNDARLVLNWTENGRPGGIPELQITDGDIVVEAAPELSIVSLVASRATVTVGQTTPTWTVAMSVRNLGGLPVDIDMAPDSTRLVLNLLAGGANVTSEYSIQQPAQFVNAGGTLLGAGMTDTLIFTILAAGVSPGTVIISGEVTGRENSLIVKGNTDAGGTGSFQLQTPGVLAIRSITPAKSTASVGQTSTYRVRMAVENTGQAAVNVDLSKPNTDLTFSGSGWNTTLAGSLAGGGVTLSGGEVDTVTFTVNTTGGPAGTATIDGNVSGTELNTGSLKVDDTLDDGAGSITLQNPAVVSIVGVTPSRSSITHNAVAPWSITVSVQNTGQAPARLDLPAGVSAAVQDGTVPFAPVTSLQGGGDILLPGAPRTLVFNTAATGAFASFGPKPIAIDVGAFDVNSNAPVGDTDNSAGILVQTAPNLQLVSLDPDTVTSGSNAGFSVVIANSDPNAATAVLDRADTRISFGGAYSAFLDLNSVLALPGGASTTVLFEDKTVSASIPLAQHDVDVDLAYAANGVSPPPATQTINNGVLVQPAPQLAILSIAPSQTTVTAGQSADWTATMRVRNNGAAPITLDLGAPATGLTFVAPGAVVDGGYTVSAPTGLVQAGGTLLGPGLEDQLIFTITQSGNLTGPVAINGRVEGDVTAGPTVFDDTFSGGRGFIDVQSSAAVAIAAVHTTQPDVTAGQTTDWGVRVVLANNGSADVDVDLAGSGITFAGTLNGWVIGGPASLLGGGDTVLEGGTVDSLLFNVDATATTPGTLRIDATVPYTEINTQTPGSANTLGSGFGSVRVETPPLVRVETTTLLAPNAPNVNSGQGYTVAVQVRNLGQAEARDVAVSMASTGSSTIPPQPFIGVVPGGQTVLVQLPATAVSAGSETLTARIDSLIDSNSGSRVTPGAPQDNNAVVNVQEPAQLAIVGVRPSQASVTQGQSSPWNVIVAVENAGGADLDLTPPSEDDLAFSIGGSTEVDYVVQAPTAFGSGAPAWRLGGGAVDSLIYTIVSTGADPGLVDIIVPVKGSDRNEPAIVLNDAGATQVQVQSAAGLAILSTVSIGTVNHATANRDTVNTGFAYQIHVTVQNLGEAVDSVLVNLGTDDGSTIDPVSFIRRSIEADSLRTFVFDVTAPPAATPLETFTATIAPGVVSHNSGEPVTPQPPVDNTQVVVTQTRASLALTLTTATPTVSPNQQFQMTARVTNAGQALVTGPAEVTLSLPVGFTTPDDTLRTFVTSQPVVWNITAPLVPQPPRNFVCSITEIPEDRNTGLDAFVAAGTAQRAVTVGTGGALGAPGVSIIAPAGATDDTVSVSQNFTVRAVVTPSADTDAVVATLTLPAGFSVVGSPVRNLGDGTGAQKQADFNIIASSLPGAAADVFVTFTGTDANSGGAVPSAADTVAVTTVSRASLSVTASVTAPADAIDNAVGVGTPFTVTASVANAGAADIGSPGTLTIAVPAPYVLQASPPQSASRPFTVGVPVQWVLVSPGQPRGPDQINISISAIPPDENSGQPSLVTAATASIPMVTEGSAVAVTEVSGSLGIDPGPVPGGTAGTELLGFRIMYNASDSNAPDAAIDSIAITVLDADGAALGNGALAQTLSRLTVDLGGAQPYEVVDPSANPVIVVLAGGGTDRIIAPDAFATAVVAVDLDASPRVTEFSVGVRSGGLRVRDTFSNQYLGVTDGNGQPLDGQITSDPLIVLSSNFEEYVHNYPNPFRAGSQATRIAYFLDQPSNVTVRIFSMTGELVYEENIPASDARGQTGAQETSWDGRNGSGEVVRNGVYVCVLNAGSKSTRFNIAVAK